MQFLPVIQLLPGTNGFLGLRVLACFFLGVLPLLRGNCQPMIKSDWWSEWEMVTREEMNVFTRNQEQSSKRLWGL